MIKIITCLIIMIPVLCRSQVLSSKVKKELRKELKQMFSEDQKYRAQLNTSKNQDSIWRVQSNADSINKNKLTQIIQVYGYPSRERIKGAEYSTILVLHMTLERDFNDLQEIFGKQLEIGNMPAKDYALWYDRCRINQKLETYYGEYGRKSYCDEELLEINKRRVEIGLLKLEKSDQCP